MIDPTDATYILDQLEDTQGDDYDIAAATLGLPQTIFSHSQALLIEDGKLVEQVTALVPEIEAKPVEEIEEEQKDAAVPQPVIQPADQPAYTKPQPQPFGLKGNRKMDQVFTAIQKGPSKKGK